MLILCLLLFGGMLLVININPVAFGSPVMVATFGEIYQQGMSLYLERMVITEHNYFISVDQFIIT
jgi:hypothetical protein